MLKLQLADKPYDLELGMGVVVKVRPCTSAVFFQAKAYMQGVIRKIREERTERKKSGLDCSDLPNLDLRETREALAERHLTIGLGKSGIIGWEGVLEPKTEKKAVLTPEKIEELFENFWVVAENFRQQYTGTRELLDAEKKS